MLDNLIKKLTATKLEARGKPSTWLPRGTLRAGMQPKVILNQFRFIHKLLKSILKNMFLKIFHHFHHTLTARFISLLIFPEHADCVKLNFKLCLTT